MRRITKCFFLCWDLNLTLHGSQVSTTLLATTSYPWVLRIFLHIKCISSIISTNAYLTPHRPHISTSPPSHGRKSLNLVSINLDHVEYCFYVMCLRQFTFGYSNMIKCLASIFHVFCSCA